MTSVCRALVLAAVACLATFDWASGFTVPGLRYSSRDRGSASISRSVDSVRVGARLGIAKPRYAVGRQHERSHTAMGLRMSSEAGEPQMQFVSALSVGFDSIQAGLEDSMERCKKDLVGDAQVDLVTIFISSRYTESRGGSTPATNKDLENAIATVKAKLGAKHVLGCLGGGVVGTGDEDGLPEEFENFKAISVCACSFPGVEVTPFRIKASDMPSGDGTQEEWRKLVGDVKPEDEPALIMFSDPEFSGSDLTKVVQGLDFAYAGCPKVGGIAATSPVAAIQIPTVFGSMAGGLSDGGRGQSSVVGVALTGNVQVEPIVAQGCSPIGTLLEVAEAKGHIVKQVVEVGDKGGESEGMMTVEALKRAIETLSPQQAQLAQTALFVGIANDDFKSEPQQGDFLIRQVVGVTVSDGSLVVGDELRTGQRIRFHIRDREGAVQEVETLMAKYKRARLAEMMGGSGKPPAAGLMMFACVGRGRGLFGEANYDSRMAYLSTGVPVAGVFCSGEIGPVSGKSFLHAYTSVFAIFRPRSPVGPEVAGDRADSKGEGEKKEDVE